MQTLLHCCFKN